MSAGIGHNRGPGTATGWSRHCWQVARRDLLSPNLPIEIVRIQVRRAKALGLDYKTYAGVRATTGRDLVAFLFSSNGLGLFRDGQHLPDDRSVRLNALDCERHLGLAQGLDAERLATMLSARSARPLPRFGASWSAMRADMRDWLQAKRLPANAVLMIGETDHEREIAGAGRLAGFLSGQRYFEGMRP